MQRLPFGYVRLQRREVIYILVCMIAYLVLMFRCFLLIVSGVCTCEESLLWMGGLNELRRIGLACSPSCWGIGRQSEVGEV
jgi:hypothetical protein